MSLLPIKCLRDNRSTTKKGHNLAEEERLDMMTAKRGTRERRERHFKRPRSRETFEDSDIETRQTLHTTYHQHITHIEARFSANLKIESPANHNNLGHNQKLAGKEMSKFNI